MDERTIAGAINKSSAQSRSASRSLFLKTRDLVVFKTIRKTNNANYYVQLRQLREQLRFFRFASAVNLPHVPKLVAIVKVNREERSKKEEVYFLTSIFLSSFLYSLIFGKRGWRHISIEAL